MDLTWNQITDVSALSGLTNLQQLYLAHNQISDISALSGLTNLGWLNLVNNQISDISALSGLTNLQWLTLQANPLNAEACSVYIPLILANNPGMVLSYDPCVEPCTLTVSSTTGGQVIQPGEGTFTYDHGEIVTLEARASAGYHFVEWSGSFASAENPATLEMNSNHEVTANFAIGQYTLTVAVTKYGSVVMPGEGEFGIGAGTILPIEAVSADPNHEFSRWSGTAIERGRVQDPNAATTTVLVDGNYTLEAVFVERTEGPVLGFSLGAIGADDRSQIEYRVADNNTPQATFVERVTTILPDPNGMVRMHVVDGEPARAKGRFGKCSAERVLVQFQYLFEKSEGVEIVVYLSDVPELLGHDDPLRAGHYVEIGRVPAPPAGRPGSFGSGRFGTFEERAWVQRLDLSHEMWVELELVETPTQVGTPMWAQGGIRLASGGTGGSALFDNLSVQVHCSGYCMDLNYSKTADSQDLLLVMASSGRTAELDKSSKDSRYCLDGVFSDDGYVDSFDIRSWDWALEDTSRVDCKNLCRVPLPLFDGGSVAVSGTYSLAKTSGRGLQLAGVGSWPAGLLVLGKPQWTMTTFDPLKYSLCLFDSSAAYVVDYITTGLPAYCDVHVVRDPKGQVYLVNSEQGVLQLSDSSVTRVIPSGRASCADDPRHHRSAEVYIGVQGQDSTCFGRPILDAAFDAQGYAYVVPVVVQPEGEEGYESAARLELVRGGNPPYRVVQLYDDPPAANDNQPRDYLREIEVDEAGNVYLVNVHRRNESDILWKYSRDGAMLRRWDLVVPGRVNNVPDPVALTVTVDGGTMYLASGQYNGQDPNNAVIYGLSAEAEDFSLVRSVTVEGMALVTSITEDPATSTLWVVGFSTARTPARPGMKEQFVHMPRLVKIPTGVTTVEAVGISDPTGANLSLPMSIVWTGAAE